VEEAAPHCRVVPHEEPGRLGVNGERGNSDQLRPSHVIELVHRTCVHRDASPFEVSEEPAVLQQRRLLPQRPPVDPARPTAVDGNRPRRAGPCSVTFARAVPNDGA